ncbi:caveolin-1-like [Plectropomus leopardus]|uniref:caveolin-1-like n=1 Tax=Plectropomus leopardus TaxID=160734 RepID=UPI001C4DAB13|nr:caveolin-1-like [Plectropomus leopardus]
MAEFNSSQEQMIRTDSFTWEIDLINRDPKQINEDVIKISFEDVIAEPAGTHSLDCVWTGSNITFTGTKYCCYRTLTAILGIPLSLIWGFTFACLSFWHIWVVAPCIKSFLINMHCVSQYFSLYIRIFIDPFFEAMGKIYSSVRVVLQKEV